MSAATERRPWPAYVNPVVWAAGVLDAVGQFRLRVNRKTKIPYGSVVRARVTPDVAEMLTDALKAGTYDGRYWNVPGSEQGIVMKNITPYLRDATQTDAAFVVYKYRHTHQFASGRGKPLTEAVQRYRQRLVAPTGEHKRTRKERRKIKKRGYTLSGQKMKGANK